MSRSVETVVAGTGLLVLAFGALLSSLAGLDLDDIADAEGALTVRLTAVGLPQETAFAVAIIYRLASFYLPPSWGWFAFRTLQNDKYL